MSPLPLSRCVGLATALVLAGAVAVAGAVPVAQAADQDTWGYTSTPKLADGSLDFSGWQVVPATAVGEQLASRDFTRDGIDYSAKINRPRSPAQVGVPLLVANTIVQPATGESWTYAFNSGSVSTLFFSYDPTRGMWSILSRDAVYYTKSSANGDVAVAIAGYAHNAGAMPNLPPIFNYSEVLDVTDDGRLVHHITITNITDATLSNIGFLVDIDTALNGEMNSRTTVNGANSVYIDTKQFRLYMDMLVGDRMLFGDAYGALNSDFVTHYKNVADYAPGTAIEGYYGVTAYGTNWADLAPGESVTLAFQERLYPPGTVTIKWVDDDNGGAAVTPKAGAWTTRTGHLGTNIGFTDELARAGVPNGYVLSSIDNAATFDGTATQTITVHLAHSRTTTSMATTRTISYTGAEANPADVVQTIDWEVSTDNLTGAVTYSNTTGYPEVASPTIAGYVAQPASVPAVAAVTGTTTVPTNETAAVVYAPEVSQVTVTFDGNGGTTPAAVTVDQGSPVGSLPTPEREGFNFTGWMDAQGAEFTATTVVNADLTVYAQWVAVNTSPTDTPGADKVIAGGLAASSATTAMMAAVLYTLVASLLIYAYRRRTAYAPRRVID